MSDADQFCELACLTYSDNESRERRVAAGRLLAARPALVHDSVRAAAAAGDVDALRGHLERDPACAASPGPLLALCYSRVAQADALGCLELLLAHGADPNAFRLIGENRFTALTGVMGEGEAGPLEQPPHPHARAMAGRLLDAGASPTESQGLYNTHFLPSNAWLELLLARGLSALADLDFHLGVAVKLGFTERVKLLLAHGARVDGRDVYNGRTHIENALLEGHTEIAGLLVAAGAQPPALSDTELVRVAVLANDPADVERRLIAHPAARQDPGALIAAARHGRLEAVRRALAVGMPIDGVDPHGLTALHHAAQRARLAVIRELVARGASRDVRDPVYGGTPLGHAEHHAARWPDPAWPEILAILKNR